ncbi:MAG TPA: VWA domain-containing protein, partial [Candidatus Binataceae bacterium]|nr:VWA domain-containing protein [Candidatus Binataceae bacterium]
GTKRMDAGAVKRLADAGGGRALFASPVASDQGASLAKAIRTIAVESRKGYAIGAVAAAHGPPPQVTLAKPARDIVRAELVPLQVLASAASRPIPLPWECPEQAPQEVRAKPGYSEIAVSVTDKDGNPVRGLKQSDLVVYSENQRYSIVYFSKETVPHSIVIAIDTSGSMEPKLERVREETAKLISGMNTADRVALLAFSGKAYLLNGLTPDHQKVIDNLKLLHAYGQTAMYDAIHDGLRLLSTTSECGRTIILVTDGIDNVSTRREGTVLGEAASKHVAIYAIGIGNPDKHHSLDEPFLRSSSDMVDKAALDAMGKTDGGADFIVPPIDSDQGNRFAQAMATVASRVHDRYKVGFIAPTSAGPVNVAVEGHDDYVVLTSAVAPGAK